MPFGDRQRRGMLSYASPAVIAGTEENRFCDYVAIRSFVSDFEGTDLQYL